MRGVSTKGPDRPRKSCPACGSLSIVRRVRRKRRYKCVYCKHEFVQPVIIIIKHKEA